MFLSKVKTGSLMERHELTWSIQNFGYIMQADAVLTKQNFELKIGSTIGIPTTLNIFLNVFNGTDGRWIGVCVKLVDPPQNPKELFCQLAIRVVKGSGETYKFVRGDKYFTLLDTKQAYGLKEVIPQSENPSILVDEDGTLTLYIGMRFITNGISPTIQMKSSDVHSQEPHFGIKWMTNFQKDMMSFLDNHMSTLQQPATKILSSDGVAFNASRDILQARSLVFRAMFREGTSESNTGIVNVSDISSNAMQVLLYFIHTGILKEEWKRDDVIDEVIYGADKYMLLDLKEYLDFSVGMICTIGNCGRLFRLAVKLGMKQAEKDLLLFCKNSVWEMNVEGMVSFLEDGRMEAEDKLG